MQERKNILLQTLRNTKQRFEEEKSREKEELMDIEERIK